MHERTQLTYVHTPCTHARTHTRHTHACTPCTHATHASAHTRRHAMWVRACMRAFAPSLVSLMRKGLPHLTPFKFKITFFSLFWSVACIRTHESAFARCVCTCPRRESNWGAQSNWCQWKHREEHSTSDYFFVCMLCTCLLYVYLFENLCECVCSRCWCDCLCVLRMCADLLDWYDWHILWHDIFLCLFKEGGSVPTQTNVTEKSAREVEGEAQRGSAAVRVSAFFYHR